MIEVTQDDDKTFTITWDENDPQESILNTWTQEDFINAEKFVQDNYIQGTNKETYGDQGTEQSKDRTLPPPNFPLFP